MGDPGGPPRVVPLDKARRGPSEDLLAAPPRVLERLAALEAQVEEALAGARTAKDPTSPVGSALDDLLAAYSEVRRWLAREVRPGPNPAGELIRRLLFRVWWRVEVVGAEHVPLDGPVLGVVHRPSPLVPYATFMVAEAFVSPSRPAIPCVEPSLLRGAVLGPVLRALGGRPATAGQVRGILSRNGLAVVAPEGPRAVGRPWAFRYHVGALTRVALLRVAVETAAPIVPVAAIGSEETQPTVARLALLGRALGLPALPLSPVAVPLPVKWVLRVGEPLDVASRWPPERARDPAALRALRAEVRERLAALLREGLRRRRRGEA